MVHLHRFVGLCSPATSSRSDRFFIRLPCFTVKQPFFKCILPSNSNSSIFNKSEIPPVFKIICQFTILIFTIMLLMKNDLHLLLRTQSLSDPFSKTSGNLRSVFTTICQIATRQNFSKMISDQSRGPSLLKPDTGLESYSFIVANPRTLLDSRLGTSNHFTDTSRITFLIGKGLIFIYRIFRVRVPMRFRFPKGSNFSGTSRTTSSIGRGLSRRTGSQPRYRSLSSLFAFQINCSFTYSTVAVALFLRFKKKHI